MARTLLALGLAAVIAMFAAAPASAGLLTFFPLPPSVDAPEALVVGPDGALRFAVDERLRALGRMTTAGAFSQVQLPRGDYLIDLAAGPDGAMWYTGQQRIGRITAAGAISQFPVPEGGVPLDIAAGPDGAMWFPIESGGSGGSGRAIGRITTTGQLSVFKIRRGLNTYPSSIVAGPDGAMWFGGESDFNSIGRITTAGKMRRFRLPSGRDWDDIAAGPDGALWLAHVAAHRIGRITTGGSYRSFLLPNLGRWAPGEIEAGPDGALWFTRGGGIGRMTTSGEITELSVPGVAGIVAGPDGAMWFGQRGAKQDRIGRIDVSGRAGQILVARLARGPYRGRRGRRIPIHFASTRAARGALELRRGRRTLALVRVRARAGENAARLRLPRRPGRYRLRVRLRVRGQAATDTAALTITR